MTLVAAFSLVILRVEKILLGIKTQYIRYSLHYIVKSVFQHFGGAWTTPKNIHQFVINVTSPSPVQSFGHTYNICLPACLWVKQIKITKCKIYLIFCYIQKSNRFEPVSVVVLYINCIYSTINRFLGCVVLHNFHSSAKPISPKVIIEPSSACVKSYGANLDVLLLKSCSQIPEMLQYIEQVISK